MKEASKLSLATYNLGQRCCGLGLANGKVVVTTAVGGAVRGSLGSWLTGNENYESAVNFFSLKIF